MRTLCLAALCLIAFPPSLLAGDATATAAARVAVLQRVAIVGASMSAGFGLDPEAGPFSGQESKVQLAQIVEASIVGPHEPVHNGATMMFFTAPEPTAKRSLATAKAAKPTVLVALDYLFWMGYGPGSDAKREERVTSALAMLEDFECPILLSDLPDFNASLPDPMMLPKESIPPAKTIVELNEKIGEWAKGRKNVVLVPQGEMLRKLIADEEIKAGGNTFEKGSRARLMQRDNLHTTLEGTCAMWAGAVDAWRAQDPSIPADALVLDVVKLAERLQAAPAVKSGPTVKPGKAKKTGPKKKAEKPVGG